MWGGGSVKLHPQALPHPLIPPRLELVITMLETSNLLRKRTYLIAEKIPFSTKTVLILLMPAFFSKKSALFGENRPLLKAIL